MHLDSYQVDDYLPLLVQAHATSGSAADLDSGSFSINFYEFDNSDGTWAAMTTPDTTFNTVVDSKTGLYTVAVQLTAANGFEAGKVYAARVGEGTVDSQTPAQLIRFRVAAKAVLDDLNDPTSATIASASATAVGDLTVDTNTSVLAALKEFLAVLSGDISNRSATTDNAVAYEDRDGSPLVTLTVTDVGNRTRA